MEVPDRHVRMNMVSTINASGQLHFMTYASTMTAVLAVFLDRLLRTTTGKIISVADCLPVHTSGAVSEWLARHRDRIEFVVMPRCAAELSPMEYSNNDVKGDVGREHLPGTRAELRSQLQRFMRRPQQVGERAANIFRHPEVQYAAAHT